MKDLQLLTGLGEVGAKHLVVLLGPVLGLNVVGRRVRGWVGLGDPQAVREICETSLPMLRASLTNAVKTIVETHGTERYGGDEGDDDETKAVPDGKRWSSNGSLADLVVSIWALVAMVVAHCGDEDWMCNGAAIGVNGVVGNDCRRLTL